jgi:N-acetylmuramoyl-L-alanine amidase
VVIDPGHGGRDTGTIGPSGLKEKDLVLDIAHRLRAKLEERLGTDVILTRDDDRFIPLEERTAIANQNSADLFISIHANASRHRRVSGVETYVLDFARSDAEREIASRENASSQRNIRELENLIKKIAAEDYNQESRDLAHVIQESLVRDLSPQMSNPHDRGVKQAPFIVLIGSNMPSILTEVGFISNPSDEHYFTQVEARDQVAEALYRGVESYFRSLGGVPVRQDAASGS